MLEYQTIAPLFEACARVAFEEAEAIVCTGFFNDDPEEFESYMPVLQRALANGLPFVCGNPDMIVDVGGTLILCAGAVAERYEEMGGKVYWAGKPSDMAYRAAQAEIDALNGSPLSKDKILAIGDMLKTDIRGAQDYGIDRLFIAQGVHRGDVAPGGRIDAAELEKIFKQSGLTANAAAYNLK